MKYTGPKARRCRKQGMNLFGTEKYARILQRKPAPPGKGPRDRLGRQSEYAVQLHEKQKAKHIYGLSEKQFQRLYREASRTMGQTGNLLRQFLERRLDNVIYRAGFSLTRLQARQLAGHGLFLIKGRRVTCPSYRTKPGEVIEVRSQSKESPLWAPILEARGKELPPSWLRVEPQKLSIEIIGIPRPDDTEQSIDLRQVIEFYSRT